MLLDITLEITPKILKDAQDNPNPALLGHLGTHFDGMDKPFPLEYTKREGVLFDVSAIKEREIGIDNIDITKIKKGTFVGFYSGYIEKVPYASAGYFSDHPVLSYELISLLTDKGVSIIGLDFGGIRSGKEHTSADQYCADRGTFVVENLVNLQALLPYDTFTVHTYPLRFAGITGHPCRVIAEI